VVSAHLRHLLLVSLYAPEGANVVTVDETTLLLLAGCEAVTSGESAQDQFSH
jgi:hypothetical protein